MSLCACHQHIGIRFLSIAILDNAYLMFLSVEYKSNLKMNSSKLKNVYALNLRMVFYENEFSF